MRSFNTLGFSSLPGVGALVEWERASNKPLAMEAEVCGLGQVKNEK
jgi:hypothetical protein